MSPKDKNRQRDDQPSLSGFADQLKLDFRTIRTILLTAGVVFLLISIPLVFLLRNFVTFDALDKYLNVTNSVRPKILSTISEEINTGYSKNFNFVSGATNSTANATMLFYAARDEKVSLWFDPIWSGGPFQPIALQLDGCPIGSENGWIEPFHLSDFDLTTEIQKCRPQELNLHTLRIVLPKGIKEPSELQVNCLVIIHQRIHEHLKESK